MSSLYYLRQSFCRIMRISTRKKVADVCSDLYSPECREEVFSETCIQQSEYNLGTWSVKRASNLWCQQA
jgi:hypothetical protein